MTQLFGGGAKMPTMLQPSQQVNYGDIAKSAANQAASAAAAGGAQSTIKTSPQGANTLASIKNPVMPGA